TAPSGGVRRNSISPVYISHSTIPLPGSDNSLAAGKPSRCSSGGGAPHTASILPSSANAHHLPRICRPECNGRSVPFVTSRRLIGVGLDQSPYRKVSTAPSGEKPPSIMSVREDSSACQISLPVATSHRRRR